MMTGFVAKIGDKMSTYQELYKKYRPKNWDELVGQTGVVRDLRREIVARQVPTAYLFAGKQHGCGKTSAAWIMAKAVNCENLDTETGNPCNECLSPDIHFRNLHITYYPD